MLIVYVLKLEDDKYYIGKTYKNLYDRVLEHSRGDGAIWTKIHKPVEILDFKPNADRFDLDLTVKKYMDRYGISNVRGGTYSSPYLSSEKYNIIREELANANDTTYKYSKKNNKIDNKKYHNQNNDDGYCVVS